jgi:hypothetical protein
MGLFELRSYATTAWLHVSDVPGVPRMCVWCLPPCHLEWAGVRVPTKEFADVFEQTPGSERPSATPLRELQERP